MTGGTTVERWSGLGTGDPGVVGEGAQVGHDPAPQENPLNCMYDLPLTGAQKSFLRGLGQSLPDHLKVGRAGLTPAFFVELQKLLRAQELVKLRFLGAERQERATLSAQVADEGHCVCVGAVGHTALFYRQNPDPRERVVSLPERSA